MDFFYKLLFSYYPYFVIVVFLFGSIYRYETNQYSWKSSSSQILNNGNSFWWGSYLFHFGIIFLLIGHFFGLLTPKFIYIKLVYPEHKQILAIFFGSIAGMFCFVGITMLLYRRLKDKRVRYNSSKSDILVIVTLYIQLLLGLFSIFESLNHIHDASVMTKLAGWVQGILLFTPDLHLYVMNEHWLFKSHLFLGMTIFLIFPFTRLIHIFSFPYLYLLRDGYQIVRRLN